MTANNQTLSNSDTDQIFAYLGIFKNFPTYQFERRIDAFMLPYLENVINKFLEIEDENFTLVYPEFPLKRLNKTATNGKKIDKLSEYADYLLYSPKLNTVYLVEFKTEIKSISESQFNTYSENCQMGWKALIEYYFDKAIGNSNWKKFVNGLLYIEEKTPKLLGDNNKLLVEPFLTNSKGIHKRLELIKSKISFPEKPEMKFIYLAPSGAEEIIKNYKDSEYYIGLLTLNDFANHIKAEPLNKLLLEIDPDKKNKIEYVEQ